MAQETSPLKIGTRGVPVRTLGIEVVDGPEAGTKIRADSETLSVGTAEGNDLVLSDSTVSRYHVELTRAGKWIVVADQGSTNGTMAGSVRIARGFVAPDTVLSLGRTRIRVFEADPVTVELHQETTLSGLRGRSRVMRRLMAQVAKAAASDTPVLLVGESGTGKELIARALHDLGARKAGPYEIVDCGSLPTNLVASELFGHERGAFTGADRQHVGAFERASGGTLFLDEIGELPPELQATLLGALERRRFRRVGGQTEIAVDVRVVSATHRDLRAEVNANSFRLDLYYRLAVVVLRVPPLRDRPDDLPMLVEHFLTEAGVTDRMAVLFPPETLERLSHHHWPGNVRELRNVVEASVAMGETPDLEHEIRSDADLASDDDVIPLARIHQHPYKDARALALREFEVRYLRALLERCDDNVSRAARVAGMDRSYLFALLKRHGLR